MFIPHQTIPPPRAASPEPASAAALLARMRAGDRDAAAEFLGTFGEQIRRRVSGKLGSRVRQVFDSQEILSTVGRRLDKMILEGGLEADEPMQLFALVWKMIDNAVKDKVRVVSRLRAAEGEDSEFVRVHAGRTRDQDRAASKGMDFELSSAFDCLTDDVDRTVLEMWLKGTPHRCIAEQVNLTPNAVRQRWEWIRRHLSAHLIPGKKQP